MSDIKVLKDIHTACKQADEVLQPLLRAFEEKRRDEAARIFDQFESRLPPDIRVAYSDAIAKAQSPVEVKLIKGECIAAAMSVYKLVSMMDPSACESPQPTNPVPVPFRDGKLN